MLSQTVQDVVTGRVRLSYVHLFTPHASQHGAEPKFSTTILVPKTDIATKQRIDAAINAAIQEGISSKWNGATPPIIAIPVYDGDGVRPSDGIPFGEECKGNWVFTASSKQAPEIVDINLRRISNQADIYSGIYARVSVRFFAYSSNEKNGIGCGLGPVQKLEDGDQLGARISAAEAFGENSGNYTGYVKQANIYNQQLKAYSQQPVYNSQMPVYNFQESAYSPQNQRYEQIQYNGQPLYHTQSTVIDPITGAPISGGVMGL